MKRQLSMELFKLRTTPAAWITLGLTVALGVASVASNILVPVQPGGPAFGSVDHINHALSSSALTSMVMLTMGILVTAGEYRHRTILQTYLGEPRRDRVLLAKLVTVGGLGAVLGAAMFGICYLEATSIYAARGVHSLPVDITRLWLGAVLASRVYGLLGVALGALTRNTVAAVLSGIAWSLVIEKRNPAERRSCGGQVAPGGRRRGCHQHRQHRQYPAVPRRRRPGPHRVGRRHLSRCSSFHPEP